MSSFGPHDFGKVERSILVVLAIKSAKRWSAYPGATRWDAIQRGMIAAKRWFVWYTANAIIAAVFFVTTVGQAPGAGHLGFGPKFLIFLGTAPLYFGVTFVRCVNASLYHQGVIYRTWAPLSRLVEPIPNVLLYTSPFIFTFIINTLLNLS